ncbi:hypothetical protein BDZ91DRAFT_724177 [Kalaharituber pfeilii]|nr:hypothetical protein BDZ91DRAFT_724177 [Kalaharituber pfeilii]
MWNFNIPDEPPALPFHALPFHLQMPPSAQAPAPPAPPAPPGPAPLNIPPTPNSGYYPSTSRAAQIHASATCTDISATDSSNSGNTPAVRTVDASLNVLMFKSPVVKIILDDGAAYYVHKESLVSLSLEWQRHVDNSMKEGLTGEMLLREVDEGTFQSFLKWTYVHEYAMQHEDANDSPLQHIKLYVLADRFNIAELRTLSFRKLRLFIKKSSTNLTSWTPTMAVEAARYAIDSLPKVTDHLVQYLLRYIAWILPKVRDMPEFASLIREHADVAITLLQLAQPTQEPPWADPKWDHDSTP